MSKELEQVLKAYNQVEEFISEMPLSYKGYNTLGASEYISDRLNEIEEALNEYVELKKALTPPTAEEVCKALSDYYGKEVLYSNDNRNGFHFYNSFYIVMLINEEIHFTDSLYFEVKRLPPHIITLIGRFYEGGMK